MNKYLMNKYLDKMTYTLEASFNLTLAVMPGLISLYILGCLIRGYVPRETPENAPGPEEGSRIVSYAEYGINKVMKTLGPDCEKHTIKDLRIKGRAEKLNGPYKEYWDNGQLRVECNFKNGKYDGLFRSYQKDTGWLYEQFTFKDGEYEGPYETYYDNGLLAKKCSYKNGEYYGLYEEYHENGQLAVKCTCKNRKYDGPYEMYYKNGQLGEKCTYKDGKKDGPYELYWRNGQLGEKCTYKDGNREGPYEAYYDNGQLEIKCTYKDGKKDGLYEEYHKTGVRERLAVYKMGRILQGQEAAEYRKEWEAKQIKIPYPKFPNINDGR